jgi:hypothetical protein
MKIRLKAPVIILLVFCGLLLLVAGFLTLRRDRASKPAPAGTEGSLESLTESAPPVRPGHARESGTRSKKSPPAPIASDAVDRLVADRALTDAQLMDGLGRLVDDAGRPLPERLEALDHLLNLAPNEKPEMLHDLAARRVLPDEVRRRLMSEALNRPSRLQGEMLVRLLENAAGDLRAELLVQLRGLCDEDLGENLDAWRAAVEKLPES